MVHNISVKINLLEDMIMSINKKATFKLDYVTQCKLEGIVKETKMSQNKVVNAAIRGLQIVNVEEGKECLKTLYEMRKELKKLKMSGQDVSNHEKKLDEMALNIYDSYPKDAYVKIKLAEEEVKNKTKSRKKKKTM